MKKYSLILITMLLAVVVSCDDATDGIQPGEFSADAAFQNVDDLEQGIFGVYSSLSIANLVSFTSIFTDEVSIGVSNGGQGLTNDALHTYTLNSNNGTVLGLWNGNYSLIFRANILIQAARSIEPVDDIEQEAYDRVLAQAFAIRAFGHSQLLSVFAEDLTNDNSLGVITIDFVPTSDTFLPRSTVGETMTFINNDLDEAQRLFSGTTMVPNGNRIFIDVDFVKALRARMALYTEDFSTAGAMADELLSVYQISDRSEFPLVWTDQSTEGVIFKADRTDNNGGLASIWNTNATNAAGGVLYEVSRSVYNIIESNPNDIRESVYIDPTSVIDPDYQNSTDPQETDILVIDKYPGDPNLNSILINDQKIFRAAEMALVKAEVQVNNGDFSGAALTVQSIRDNRFGSVQPQPTYSDAQEAWRDILLERRVELFLEGHRYIDFNRLAEKANVTAYDRDETDCSIPVLPLCDLPRSDIRTQAWPIPQAEFAGNPAISGQQNPGY
ncbi:MAG: RagB/SusD family nutrient uptake outer membrane protein [Nonlabens sp.]